MTLDQDKVPINLEDALAIIKGGMTPADMDETRKTTFTPAQLHFSVGRLIRNDWSLWDKETILVKWFKQRYGIDHADDISGLILDCLHKDMTGEPRRDELLAKKYLDHWKKQK